MKIKNILPYKSLYLKPLTHIAKPPKAIYYNGTLPYERIASVAVVGSRKPTSYGKEITLRLASDLASRGIVIISGLALGVDGLAHQAAISAGGRTIAVVANGVDIVYPASHRKLAQDIIESGGAILSEYKPGTEARGYQFLERNRIVSGLADAILITEAATRSGTLSTAAHALEQGKDIFVVPGNITSPLSAGCNNLLKQGAHVATCAEDILEIIAPDLLCSQSILPLGATPLEATIIDLIQLGVRDGDELLLRSKTNVSEFSQTITMMEIEGKIRGLGGNQWTLR